MPTFTVASVKEFEFKRPDSQRIGISVPTDLNQSLLKTARPIEYGVFLVATGRDVLESEVCALKYKNSTVGFLIPGQAILSPEHPRNADPLFGTYSLIVANAICTDSRAGIYTRANVNCKSAISKNEVFAQNIFYAAIWLEKLKLQENEFFPNYFVSLAQNGIFPSPQAKPSGVSTKTLDTYNSSIILTKNRQWPEYVETISSTLSPYASDPFLRFFYTYQIIEALMASDYSSRFLEIRSRFTSQQNISITHLKDFVDEFQHITKEKPRIKNALQPCCPATNLVCEKILTHLGEDFEKLDFAERIYRIRNIIFHDFQRIKSLGEQISDLEDNLSSYLLHQKLK